MMVSISCITYNHAPYIRECLDGFIMQECNFDFEILIHDDASTDGTQEIIKEYAEKYPDLIKPIYQTENQYSKGQRGMNVKYNFPRAKGKYIALCEGDDYWTDPLKLQKQVDFLEENSNYSFCCHRFKVKIEKNYTNDFKLQNVLVDKNGYTNEMGVDFYNKNDLEIDYTTFYSNWVTQPLTAIFRSDYMVELQDFLQQFVYARDIHLFYFLLKKGNGISLNQFMGVYRRHNGGIESSVSEINALFFREKLWYELFLKFINDKNLRLQYLESVVRIIKILPFKQKIKYYLKALPYVKSIKYFAKLSIYMLR